MLSNNFNHRIVSNHHRYYIKEIKKQRVTYTVINAQSANQPYGSVIFSSFKIFNSEKHQRRLDNSTISQL